MESDTERIEDESWKELAPLLDEALDRLSEKDRSLLTLRFLHGLETPEVCAALKMNRDGVKKRQSRALEKLRDFFARQGIKTTAQGLAVLISGHLTEASPTVPLILDARRDQAAAALARETEQVMFWNCILQRAGVGAAVLCLLVMPMLLPSGQNERASTENDVPAGDAAGTNRLTRNLLPVAAASPSSQDGIRITVLDKQTGALLEGVAMRPLFSSLAGKNNGLPVASDAEGRAWIDLPDPKPARIDIGLLKEGWQQTSLMWIPFRGEMVPKEYSIQLARAVSIGGWVQDAQASAIPGAAIQLRFRVSGDFGDYPPQVERPGFVGEWVVARTDQDGYWRTAVVPRDLHAFSIAVTHESFAATNAGINEALFAGESVTVMSGGFTLKGVVLNREGIGIKAATIIGKNGTLKTATGEGGLFALPHLSGGELPLAFVADGFAPRFEAVEIPAGKELRVELDSGAPLKLRIVNENGEGIGGAGVMLENTGESGYSWSALADASGRVSWDHAPAGIRRIYAFAEGYYDVRNQVIRPDGAEHEIVLHPVILVRGTVLDDESGSPITKFRVVPGYRNIFNWAYASAASGVDGAFQLESRVGPSWFRIEAEGYAPAELGPIEVSDGGTNLMVRLKNANPDNGLLGYVLRADGSPAVAAEVALGTIDHQITIGQGQFVRQETPLRATTGENGRFAFEPHSYAHTVAATHPEGFALRRMGEGEGEVLLQLEPWARIEGVVGEETSASGFVQIETRPMHRFSGLVFDPVASRVPVSPAGTFLFERVPPGRFTVTHAGGKDGSEGKRVEVQAGETAWVDLGSMEGVTVTGRYLVQGGRDGRLSGQGVIFQEAPHPVPPEGLSPSEAKIWAVQYWNSPVVLRQLESSHTRSIQLDPDGRFRILNVPPGSYTFLPNLALVSTSNVIHLRTSNLTNIVVPDGEDGALFELGTIPMEPLTATN